MAKNRVSVEIIYQVPRRIARALEQKMLNDTKKVKTRPQARSKIDMLSLFKLDHTMMPVHIRKYVCVCVCVCIYICI